MGNSSAGQGNVERVTIDTNVARDYLDSGREGFVFAEALVDLARQGVVSLAIAASGYNYDLSDPGRDDIRQELRKLIADEGIEIGYQLAYPGPHTYPAKNLVPGAFVAGFPEAWSKMVDSWSSDRMGKGPPGNQDRLHVESHLLHRRDVFITNDRPLLTICERLRKECGWQIDATGSKEYVGRFGLP